jgi:hypothetical protein
MAIEQGADLVPVLALGETLQLRNLWDAPDVQQYTYKRLGFPLPYLLVGRWGVSPMPKKTSLVYALGEPLAPPPSPPSALLCSGLGALASLPSQRHDELLSQNKPGPCWLAA